MIPDILHIHLDNFKRFSTVPINKFPFLFVLSSVLDFVSQFVLVAPQDVPDGTVGKQIPANFTISSTYPGIIKVQGAYRMSWAPHNRLLTFASSRTNLS